MKFTLRSVGVEHFRWAGQCHAAECRHRSGKSREARWQEGNSLAVRCREPLEVLAEELAEPELAAVEDVREGFESPVELPEAAGCLAAPSSCYRIRQRIPCDFLPDRKQRKILA